MGNGPPGGLGDVTEGGGALGSAVGNGAGAADLDLSSPNKDDFRCSAASARNWATGGRELREGSTGRAMGRGERMLDSGTIGPG